MTAILVIVGEVVAEQTAKVIGVEHYDVIEELAADAEHPPFADTVLPGRPRGDAHRSDILPGLSSVSAGSRSLC
jgi:hypothetical protein